MADANERQRDLTLERYVQPERTPQSPAANYFAQQAAIRHHGDGERLAAIASLVDITFSQKTISHRPYIGWLIVGLKRACLGFARPLLKVLFWRQMALNEHTLALAATVMDLRRQLEEVKQQLEQQSES